MEMTDLDKLEDLLRKGEKEKAYELVKEDKGITTEILMNEGIFLGTLEEYSISISYFELVERISENNRIKEDVREILVMAYYNQGIAHFGLKEYKEAIEDYSKAIDLNPKDTEAYNNRGNVYHKLNQHEEAIKDYSKAIDLNPNLALLYFNRGNLYRELKQYEKAIEDCNRAIDLNPKYSEAYYNRGVIYHELKQHKEAVKDYSKVIDLNPKYSEVYYNRGLIYHELNQQERAIEDFNRAIELNPKYSEAYYNRGVIYHELNQQEKAIEDFNRAIDLNPEDPEAYYNRGLIYHELNQQERAIEDYNRAIELNSNPVEAYYNRGLVYHELNQQERAIEDYNRAIEGNPEYAYAYNNRGNAYCELKQYEKAIGDCNRAIGLNPKYTEAYFNRGNAYLGLKLYKEAIEDCNKAIGLNPKYVAAYNSRGAVYSELEQYEKAIEDCNKMIELNPKFAEAYFNRGIVYSKLEQYEKAIEDCNKAIELNPKFAEAYFNRGNAYYLRLNHYKEAIEDYNKAIELNPKFAKCYMNRGLTHLQANEDLDNAIEDFKRARDLFEGKEKDSIFGFIEWAKARNEMNFKRWDNFRERMNEAREIFENTNDPLSRSIHALIEFSYLDEKLDKALNILDPIDASEAIENALKNLPEVEELFYPERTIFGARIASFLILSDFFDSVRGIEENTDLGKVKEELTNLHERSKEVEKLFESVNFDTGKTTIVDMQRIISSVKQEIVKMERGENKKQKALEILKKYWSRLSSAIQAMNGISTREIENIAVGRQIREMKSELLVGFAEMRDGLAETEEIITTGFEKHSVEHEEILEKIYETKNILLQKDAVNARYRIEIQAPLISSLSPISPKIIVDIPMGNVTEAQIEEKAEEIADKIKDLSGKVKKEFLEAIKRVPETGKKLWTRLKKTKG